MGNCQCHDKLCIQIPRCHDNRGTSIQVKDGPIRLDRVITGTMKPVSITGALKSCDIMPE